MNEQAKSGDTWTFFDKLKVMPLVIFGFAAGMGFEIAGRLLDALWRLFGW